MLQISHPPSSILIQLNPIYLTDPLYLSHWVSKPGPPRAISRIIVSENGNAPPRRSELNLNRYGVASPYHTIRNVCGFVSLS
nr:MAG TPA: hypothetical protein [Caudoviricetes sp.]